MSGEGRDGPTRREFLEGSLGLMALVLGAPGGRAGPRLESWLGTEAGGSRAVLPAFPPWLPDGAVARLGSWQLRHGGQVTGLAFSPDGSRLASAGTDRQLCLWDSESGALLEGYRLPGGTPAMLVFTGDGSRLVFAADGVQVLGPDGDGPRAGARRWISAVAGAPAAGLLAVGVPEVLPYREGAPGDPNRGFVEVFRAAGGAPIARFEALPGPVHLLAFTGAGDRLVAAGRDRRLRVFETRSWRLVEERSIDPGPAGLAVADDGTRVALGSPDGRVRVLGLAGNPDGPALAGSRGGRVAFVPGTRDLVLGRPGGLAQVSAVDGREVRRLEAELPELEALAVDPGGTRVAVAHRGRILVFDLPGGKARQEPVGLGGALTAMAASGDGTCLAVAGADLRIRLLDLGRPTAPPRVLAPQPEEVQHMAALGPGARLALHGYRARISLLDCAAGAVRELAMRPGSGSWAFAAGADGGRVAYAVNGPRGPVVVIEDPGGTPRSWETFDGGRDFRRFSAMALSPDGELLAVLVEEDEVLLLELRSGRWAPAPLRDPAGSNQAWGPRRCLAFSPARPGLLAWGRESGGAGPGGDGGRILFFEARAGRVVGAVAVADRAAELAFAPDGGRLASAGGPEGTLSWIDPGAGRVLASRPAHRGPVAALAFSPDGRRVYSAGADSTVVVWEAARLG